MAEITMQVYAWGDEDMLLRHCVDCGLRTGCYCDYCYAADRDPTQEWADGQLTPLCSKCDRKHDMCHYCRGEAWATPKPHPTTTAARPQPKRMKPRSP